MEEETQEKQAQVLSGILESISSDLVFKVERQGFTGQVWKIFDDVVETIEEQIHLCNELSHAK